MTPIPPQPLTQLAHALRAHAKLSASGAEKWLTCTQAPSMEELVEEDPDSDASREGTFAHSWSEMQLVRWWDRRRTGDPSAGGLAETYTRSKLMNAKEYAEFYDEEFQDHCDAYCGRVRERVEAEIQQHGMNNVQVLFEQRLPFTNWVPEGFGTADVIIIVPGKIIVIDLKFGRGIWVDGEDNTQMKIYALAALQRYGLIYDFDTVDIEICQPRKDNYSGDSIALHDLLDWAESFVKPQAQKAFTGEGAEFNPGHHCKTGYCRARFQCRARAEWLAAVVEEDFMLKPSDILTLAEAEQAAVNLDALKSYVSEVQSWLLAQAIAGKALTLHKLVEGRSARKITNEALLREKLLANDIPLVMIMRDPKMAPLTTLEANIGKSKFKELAGDLVQKEPGAPKLDRIDSAKPTLIIGAARKRHFDRAEDDYGVATGTA